MGNAVQATPVDQYRKLRGTPGVIELRTNYGYASVIRALCEHLGERPNHSIAMARGGWRYFEARIRSRTVAEQACRMLQYCWGDECASVSFYDPDAPKVRGGAVGFMSAHYRLHIKIAADVQPAELVQQLADRFCLTFIYA